MGRKIGLISDDRWNRFTLKQEQKKEEIKRLKSTVIPPSDEVNEILVSRETSAITTGVRLIDLMKRPQINYECLTGVDTTRPQLDANVLEQVEIDVKYEGYIKRQLEQIEKMRKLEEKKLPKLDFAEITGLRLEAIEKLNKVKPQNIGQASRISGVSPADITALLVYFKEV